MARQIDEDRPEPVAPTPRPLVDAHDAERLPRRPRDRADEGEQRGAPHGQAEGGGESGTRRPAQREPDALQHRAPDARLAGVTVDEAREPLGEDAPRAGGVPAEEAPHLHPERHGHAAPRHIGDHAHIAAVDATGRMLTRRARGGRGDGGDPERDPPRRRCVFVKAEAFKMGQERRGIHSLLQAGATTAQPASIARTAPDGPPRSSNVGKT